MNGPSLVCIGNLTIDEAVHGGVNAGPAMGGDAAYAALAARQYLDDVRMLAPIGTDLPPGLLADLSAAGVNTTGLPVRDLPTVRNLIDYAADGSRSWHLQCSESDFDRMSVYPVDVPAQVLNADGIVLLAMSLQSQLTLTPWLRAYSAATVYLDVQEDYLEGNLEDLHAMISCCDVFLPSEVEAYTLTGCSDIAQAATVLKGLGPRTVVITRAERGVLLLTDRGSAVEIPVDAVEPLDSTGAGDAFCGAFAAVHTATDDPVAAVEAGSAAARIAIGSYGIDGLLSTVTDRRPRTVRHDQSGPHPSGQGVLE